MAIPNSQPVPQEMSYDDILEEKIMEAEAAAELSDFAKAQKEAENLIKDLLVDADTKEISDSLLDHGDLLALFVHSCFESSEKARRFIEEGWVRSLKQYKGVYEDGTLARISPNRSQAFVRVSRTKVKTVDSRLIDLLFPANGEKNWDITPTPLPELSPKRKTAIIDLYKEESGEDITPEVFDIRVQQEAEKQSKKMETLIADQLAELRYRETIREVLHSGNLYGTGILKGPLASVVENTQYYKQVQPDGTEKWLLKEFDKVIPYIEHVQVWDVYPDMESTSFQDSRYVIQRRKMNKHDLLSLSARPDFSGDTIKNYVENHPTGDYEKKSFEQTLYTIGDVISTTQDTENNARKYEVLEYWGYVDSHDLEQFGVEVPEKYKGLIDIPANIWVLGNKVIKAAVSPIEGIKWPYFAYYYDKDETSIFGEGIPSIMSDIQELINSAFRAMLDNAAISAGPQIEVNLDLLSEDEDPREVHPFKVWLRTGTGVEASNPCIRAITMQSYTQEFERMIAMFKDFSDEVTTIPRNMWGEASASGVGRTATGISMLMGSANTALKDQVKNFDDGITKPFITAMYRWNMQFSPNDDVKGDYGVMATGSASLIAKELYTQSLINFANIVNNPQDSNIVRRPNIIRAIAEAFELKPDKFVLSEKEIQAQKQQQLQQQEEERDFMNMVVEAAREQGISPETLMNTARNLQKDIQQTQQVVSRN